MNYRIKKQKKKKRGVDYNAEIPFEKKPAPGINMLKQGWQKLGNTHISQDKVQLHTSTSY